MNITAYNGVPDFKPWDPRIKFIEYQEVDNIWGDKLNLKIYLHCGTVIGFGVIKDVFANSPMEYFWKTLIYKVQPKIDDTYADMRKLAGGSVDIYGKLIVKPKLVEVSLMTETQTFEPTFQTVSLTPEEEWNHWCKQAGLDISWEQHQIDNGEVKLEGYVTYGLPTIGVAATVQENLEKLCPGLLDLVDCPSCDITDFTLKNAIIHLNDKHKWDRMALADWIESLDIDTEFKE